MDTPFLGSRGGGADASSAVRLYVTCVCPRDVPALHKPHPSARLARHGSARLGSGGPAGWGHGRRGEGRPGPAGAQQRHEEPTTGCLQLSSFLAVWCRWEPGLTLAGHGSGHRVPPGSLGRARLVPSHRQRGSSLSGTPPEPCSPRRGGFGGPRRRGAARCTQWVPGNREGTQTGLGARESPRLPAMRRC